MVVGCSNSQISNNKRNDDTQSNYEESEPEGGENGLVRGYYQFSNYDEFSFFIIGLRKIIWKDTLFQIVQIKH